MTVDIRPFRQDDLNAILDIAVAAWEPIVDSSRNMVGPALFDLVYPDPAQRKRDQITRACGEGSPTLVWVADDGGEIVGFITAILDESRKVGEIGNNAVAPSQQGKGIGTSMYRYVIDQMKAAQMESAIVVTGGDQAHAPARRAYEIVGFSGAVPSAMYYMEIK
ncbi:MAG: GNAT family N-acetyltransferase [Chloroflexi bacterium]|nr:GNAT family N-acetyltransferase [Chloroflexota bacterium]